MTASTEPTAEEAGGDAGLLANPVSGAPLDIDVTSVDGVAVVALRGTLDIATTPAFDQRIDALRRNGTTAIRVDLSDLSFIDSHGLGALLRAWRAVEPSEGSIEVVGPTHPNVVRVFAISGADDELRFTRT